MAKAREDPPFPTEPLKWIGYHLRKDWRLLKQAPLASCCLFVAGALVAGLVATYLVIPYKNAVIESKNALIEVKDNKITNLEAQLKVATETIDLSKLPPWVNKLAIKRPLATEEDLKQDIVVGKTVFVNYIPNQMRRIEGIGEPALHISGKTFQDCDLIGPAIISFTGDRTVVEHCQIEAPSGSRLESVLLLTQDRYCFGIIPFNDCGILNCKFIDIGFASNAEGLEEIKKSLEHH